jgi:hypothetical protein
MEGVLVLKHHDMKAIGDVKIMSLHGAGHYLKS